MGTSELSADDRKRRSFPNQPEAWPLVCDRDIDWVEGHDARRQRRKMHRLDHNPHPLRAQLIAASLASNVGRFDAIMHQTDKGEPLLPERDNGAATIWQMTSYCVTGKLIPSAAIDALRQGTDDVIGPLEREAFDMLTRHLAWGTCPLDSLGRAATAASRWFEGRDQPPRDRDVRRYRYDVARRILKPVESVQDHNDRRQGRTIEAFRTYLQKSSPDGEVGITGNDIPHGDRLNPETR